MNRIIKNRPFKLGENNRVEGLVQDSEVSLIAINDTNGNPVFLGRAKTGTSLSNPKWQIRKIEYDSAQAVTRITWPKNEENSSSANYEFIWSTFSSLSITNITKANPAVVTVSSLESLSNGTNVIIQSVQGMTQVNFDGSNIYTVANINVGAKTFELSGIDSSSYDTYTTGGTVNYGQIINYTYS